MNPQLSHLLASFYWKEIENPTERISFAFDLINAGNNISKLSKKWVKKIDEYAQRVGLSDLLKSDISSLTKAGRNEVDAALQALDKIPDVEPGEIASPWVITRRPKLDNEEWRASVIKSVPITMLLASQPRLTRERVEHFILNPGSIEQGRRALPNVYDHGNEQVIVDGHHRLAALWLLGADHANVWLLEGSE